MIERKRILTGDRPTGRLHLGNVRAAAFNWLFARRHGGAFEAHEQPTGGEGPPGPEDVAH